jgi:light-independent protochlorophyllide reductase subunit N
VRVLNYSGSGIETTFTQGEDACLAALVPELPERADTGTPQLLVAGALADIVEDQFRRTFAELGMNDVAFLPPRQSSDLPAVGPGTRVLLAQPFLTDTTARLQERGCEILSAPFPYGVEGTTAWLAKAAELWNVPKARFEDVIAPAAARARKALEAHRFRLSGKRVFFFPDSQLEIPLARFLAQELGMMPVEVGTPYLNRQQMALDLEQLPQETLISEGQDVERQLDRCRSAKPDLIVCGLGLANPLEAEGFTTKWSIELLFTPVQGFEQAGDLAELFTRPLVRRTRLEV